MHDTVPSIERKPSGQFAKGSSGNLFGRPKAFSQLMELCRTHTPEAVAALAEIVSNKNVQAAQRIIAAVALLDRGYGKPATTHFVVHNPVGDNFTVQEVVPVPSAD